MAVRIPAFAAVFVLAVAFVVGFDVSVGNTATNMLLRHTVDLWVMATVISLPWWTAIHLVLKNRRPASGIDPPAQLLATAVATLPEERQEWGAAMAAELSQVSDPSARWRFALGCARTALFPPRGGGKATLIAGAVAVGAVVVAALAAGDTMQVFAITLAGLAGALLLQATARSRKIGPVSAVTAAGLVGVGLCIASTGYFLARYPIGSIHLTPAYAIFFAALLAGCLWLTLTPPRTLAAEGQSQGVAVGSALMLGAGLMVASRLGLNRIGGLEAGIIGYLFLIPVGAIPAVSALVAARGRSFSAGATTAVWTTVLTSLAVCAVAIFESVTWYDTRTSLILAGDGIPIEAVGENLRNFIWAFILLPFWWLPFGLMGAAASRRLGARRRGAVPG